MMRDLIWMRMRALCRCSSSGSGWPIHSSQLPWPCNYKYQTCFLQFPTEEMKVSDMLEIDFQLENTSDATSVHPSPPFSQLKNSMMVSWLRVEEVKLIGPKNWHPRRFDPCKRLFLIKMHHLFLDIFPFSLVQDAPRLRPKTVGIDSSTTRATLSGDRKWMDISSGSLEKHDKGSMETCFIHLLLLFFVFKATLHGYRRRL